MRALDPPDPQSPPTDPRSWRYQAAIHGVTTTLPPADVRQLGWKQCKHNSWFFLPWHRIYLQRFEQIIQQLIGNPDWRLPYWDYSDYSDLSEPRGRPMPPEFLQGSAATNPLFRDGRRAQIAAGSPLGIGQVSLAALYQGAHFGLPVADSAASFGGGMTTTPAGSSTRGLLERIPHGQVHGAVGGDMGTFETAGLDPIFWLHHCNIDRLWEVWRTAPAHLDPDAATGDGQTWFGTSYSLFDASGAPAPSVVGAVLDTAALGYTYESIEPPVPWPEPAVGAFAVSPEEDTVAELVGGYQSDEGIALSRSKVTVDLDVPLAADAVGAFAPTGPARRVFVRVEDVTGADLDAVSYGVFLNTPEDADPLDFGDRRIGSIASFGIAEASVADDDNEGNGLTDVFDATEAIDRLSAEEGWDPEHIDVTFVAEGIDGEAVDDDGVHARRVSFYVE